MTAQLRVMGGVMHVRSSEEPEPLLAAGLNVPPRLSVEWDPLVSVRVGR